MKTLLTLLIVAVSVISAHAGDYENQAARAAALANLNATIANGNAAKALEPSFDAAADQVLRLRIQQAYPGNTSMWQYLYDNPRQVPYFLGNR